MFIFFLLIFHLVSWLFICLFAVVQFFILVNSLQSGQLPCILFQVLVPSCDTFYIYIVYINVRISADATVICSWCLRVYLSIYEFCLISFPKTLWIRIFALHRLLVEILQFWFEIIPYIIRVT